MLGVWVQDKPALPSVGFEENVTSSDEEEPLCILALNNEETTRTHGMRCKLSADGMAKRSGEGISEIYRGIGRVGGCEELGTR